MWPKTLGQRDRSSQHESYTIPLTPEEKIAITQGAHFRAQKDINKAMKFIERAIVDYSDSPYGSEKVIEILAKEKMKLVKMKESIKKETYNALPYKELNEAGIQEQAFYDIPRRMKLKTKLILTGVAAATILGAYGYFFDRNLFAIVLVLAALGIIIPFLLWGRKHRSNLASKRGYKGQEWKK